MLVVLLSHPLACLPGGVLVTPFCVDGCRTWLARTTCWALPHPDIRRAAAELVAQLLEEQGRTAVELAAATARQSAATEAEAAQGAKAAGKARGGRSKGGASSSKDAGAAGGAAAAAAAAAAGSILDSCERLQRFGLLAVMARDGGA